MSTASPPPSKPNLEDQPPGPAVDITRAAVLYVNFSRLHLGLEEITFDFALQSERTDATHPITAPQRISMSLYTGKRLLELVTRAVELHETAFGPLELDVENRFLPPAT